MILKHKRSDPMALIKSLAEDPSSLTLQVRIFVTAINTFQLQLKPYRELLLDLKVFSPLVDYINEIDEGLKEGILWIAACLDEKIDLTELVSNLKNDTAQGFEANLNAVLAQCRYASGDTPIIVQEICDDVDSLCERTREDIRNKGFKLHSILIGAE